MALHILPVGVSRPPFRRLLREENAVSASASSILDEEGSDIIRVPENLRYPQALMNIEDMTILLETKFMPATSDAHYEDTQTSIDQYSFEFGLVVPVQSVTGAIVSQKV